MTPSSNVAAYVPSNLGYITHQMDVLRKSVPTEDEEVYHEHLLHVFNDANIHLLDEIKEHQQQQQAHIQQAHIQQNQTQDCNFYSQQQQQQQGKKKQS